MRSPAPEAQLLGNGDILVPVERRPGPGWDVIRLEPDDSDYAEWLAYLQEREREPSPLARGVRVLVGLVALWFLLPIFVFVVAGVTLVLAHVL